MSYLLDTLDIVISAFRAVPALDDTSTIVSASIGSFLFDQKIYVSLSEMTIMELKLKWRHGHWHESHTKLHQNSRTFFEDPSAVM